MQARVPKMGSFYKASSPTSSQETPAHQEPGHQEEMEWPVLGLKLGHTERMAMERAFAEVLWGWF